MTPLIITSEDNLQRLIDSSVESVASRLLTKLPKSEAGPKEWMTNKEVMAFLGLSKTTLQRYRNDGLLPYSKVGANIFYRYQDVIAFLEEHHVS